MEENLPSPGNIPAAGQGGRRWLRTATWMVAAVALLIVVSWFAVPPLVERLLVGGLGGKMHRPVTVRKVQFNPLRLSLTVTGFAVGEREGSGEFLAFDELFVDLEAISIVHWAPVLREVRLRGTRAHFLRPGRSRPAARADGQGQPRRPGRGGPRANRAAGASRGGRRPEREASAGAGRLQVEVVPGGSAA